MDQYAGFAFSRLFLRGEGGRRGRLRKGKGVERGCAEWLAPFTLSPKSVRKAQQSSALHKDTGHLSIAHPGDCHPPGILRRHNRSFGRSKLGEFRTLSNVQEAGMTFLPLVSGLLRRHQPCRSQLVNPACAEAIPATLTPLKGQQCGLQTTC